MNNRIKAKLADRLKERVKKMFDSQRMSRSINEVFEMIEHDPELFERCLKRAKSYRDVDSGKGVVNTSLWIACNLVESLERAPYCYFCGRTITQDDFMNGKVHLEHFEPRIEGGIHQPINITLACKQCNQIKSRLTDKDMLLVLNDPASFFSGRRFSDMRKKQLIDFAETYYPRIAGLQGYAERHGLREQNIRSHWEELRRRYRDKWQKT